MKSLNLRRGINLSIALSFIGLFIVFPFQHTFIGGLLFAALAAATIGGLADSFAVSALFGQPLKVKWPAWLGTNIIARNRDRLIEELVDMVENELLSTEMIAKQLKNYDAAAVIVHYAESDEGRQVVKELVQHLLTQMLATANPAVLSLSLKRLIKQGIQNSDIVTVISQLMLWSVKHGYEQVLISSVAKQLQKMLQNAGIKGFFESFIAQALQAYEQDKKSRQFVNGVAGLNAADLTEKLLKVANKTLQAIEKGEHQVCEKITQYIHELAGRMQTDEEFRSNATAAISSLVEKLSGTVLSAAAIERYLTQLQQQLEQTDNMQLVERAQYELHLGQWLTQKLDEWLLSLSSQVNLLNQINQYIRSTLLGLLERNHGYVGKLVRTKLNEFSEEQLIALVQEKTAKDLQYIRLNGTAVGALIGILLYLIQYSIGGLLS